MHPRQALDSGNSSRATTRYSTSLLEDSRRPQCDEIRSTVAGLGLGRRFLGSAIGSFRLTASRIRSLYIHDLGPHFVFGGAAFLNEMIEYKLEPPNLSSFHQFLLLVASDVAELKELRDGLVQT